MPGVIPHFIIGLSIFLISRHIYHELFHTGNVIKKQILLFSTCMISTFSPDIVMIYFRLTTHYDEYLHCLVEPYHIMVHIIIGLSAIIVLPLVYFFINSSKRAYLLTGLWCIIIHMIMDITIVETSIFF